MKYGKHLKYLIHLENLKYTFIYNANLLETFKTLKEFKTYEYYFKYLKFLNTIQKHFDHLESCEKMKLIL